MLLATHCASTSQPHLGDHGPKVLARGGGAHGEHAHAAGGGGYARAGAGRAGRWDQLEQVQQHIAHALHVGPASQPACNATTPRRRRRRRRSAAAALAPLAHQAGGLGQGRGRAARSCWSAAAGRGGWQTGPQGRNSWGCSSGAQAGARVWTDMEGRSGGANGGLPRHADELGATRLDWASSIDRHSHCASPSRSPSPQP